VHTVIIPSLDRFFGAVGEQRSVFYASDDFVAGAELMRISAARLRRETRRQRARADLIVAASPTLAATLRADGHDPLLGPNGVDPGLFATVDEVPPPPGLDLARAAGSGMFASPAAGFMGHLTSRIDVRHLDVLASRGHPLLLVGPAPGGLGEGLGALVRRTNVEWVGPQPFESLPSYLGLMDVGLIPYADTPFSRASFPLKALEYLAAGRPVVSTEIDGLRWLRDTSDGMITDDDLALCGSPDEFAERAGVMLGTPRTDDDVRRRRAFAARHSWDSRFAELAATLDLGPRRDRPNDHPLEVLR
jgi:teichuronic acid biosynthesis glycosyltransferase TuaH